MDGGVVTNLAKQGLEKLIDKAITELRYVCCYTSIVEDFEKEKERLVAERIGAGQRTQVLKGRGDTIQYNASHWEKEADKLIQEDTKTNLTCFPGCIRRYRRGKELSSKTEEIKKLVLNVNKTLENIGLPTPVPGVERYSSQNYISFKSRESEYNKLLDALKDDNNYIFGLQGMGGTGKNTLAKQVGKQLKQSKIFDHVIDTIVSSFPNIKKIQDDIAAPLGLRWENCTDSERPGKLWKRLTNGEKILLILDDVWEWGNLNFEEIGIPSIDNHEGFKVLITTRELQVCYSMECQSIIQLQVLSEDDAWIMFKNHVGKSISNSSSKKMLDTGREITKCCKRLPVAIAVVARSLRGQQRQGEWDEALKSLRKNHGSMDCVDKNLAEIYECLRFSYDNMKDEKDKRIFLLFSIFPEDMQVPYEIFITFGKGTGLFGELGDKYDDVRSQVILAINRLIDSCLLLNIDKGFLTMHDLVREASLWIGKKEIQEVNMSDLNQKSLVESKNKIKYLSCKGKGIDIFSCMIDVSELEILNIFINNDENDFLEVPNSFFKNMKKLRVLYIVYSKRWGLKALLPQSIGSLTNIQSLFFYRLELGDIFILGKLQSLETLEFFDCSFIELPPEIAKLKKLRLLRLRICKCYNPYEVIERCLSLEELYVELSMRFIFGDIVAIHQLRTPLQRYSISDNWEDGNKDGSPSSSKQVSLLENRPPFFSVETIKYFVQTAEDLRLNGNKWEWKNLMPEIIPIDEGMNDLVHLKLRLFPQLQCLVENTSIDSQGKNVFSRLAELELERMDNLKELCNGLIPSDFLTSLKKLNMDTCLTLESLFQLSTARSLVLLEELKIKNCSQLKNTIIGERTKEEWREEMFPRLRVLTIRNCPQLQVILPFVSPRDVPVLEVIKVSCCDELKYIFGQYKHEHEGKDLKQVGRDAILGPLQEMELIELPNFIDIFPECDHPVCSSVKRSSSKDGSKARMQSEPIKCNIFPWHILRSSKSTKIPLDSTHQSQDCSTSLERIPRLLKPLQILHNIKEIYFWNISKIDALFVLSVARTMLLESLSIEKCVDLKEIITDTGDCGGIDVFPKLKYLRVEDCKELEYVFGLYSQNHMDIQLQLQLQLPALESIILSGLSNLIGTCPKSHQTMLPSLKKFTFRECPNYSINSIGDFFHQLESRQIKDQRGGNESNAQNILCTHEMIGQALTLPLQKIELGELPQMKYLFVGPKNSLILQNLISIQIVGCEKLEIIFSTSTVRSLPQLRILQVEKCKELKQIIEEDKQDQKISKTCFPKLEVLIVQSCNKLKCVFPFSICKELPGLKMLMIKEAHELEEVLGGSGDKKVEFLNLIFVVFVQLPSLCQGFQFQTVMNRFVQNCPNLSLTSLMLNRHIIKTEFQRLYREFCDEGHTFMNIYWHFQDTIKQLEDSKTQDSRNGNSIAEITEDFPIEPQVQAVSLTSSQVNTNLSIHANTDDQYHQNENDIVSNEFIFPESIKTEQTPEAKQEFVENVASLQPPSLAILPTGSSPSPLDVHLQQTQSHELLDDEQSMGEPCLMDQQQTLVETDDITFQIHQENTCLKETRDQSIQDCSASEKILTTTLSSDSETRTVPPITSIAPGMKISVEEVTASTNAETIPLSTHLELELVSSQSNSLVTSEYITYSQEDNEGQIAIPSFLAFNTLSKSATKDVNVGDSQEAIETNDPVFLNDDAPMDVSSIIEETFSTNDDIGVFPSHVKSHQSPSMPSEGNSSQIIEDLNFTSLVSYELEQLVSKKQLAFANLSGMKRSVEEVTTSANAQTIPLSTHSELVSSQSNSLVTSECITYSQDTLTESATKDVNVGDSQEAIETNDLVFLNDDAPMDVSSIIEETFSTNDDIGVFPSEGNSSQIIEDLNFTSLVRNELEQLVSKKHLGFENLSLLVDFLVKHPSVRLTSISLSNRYKGYGYTCLAELLKFLQTHSVLDVLESSHTEFVELLQDVRRCGFDKDWLDGVERRALIRGSHVSEDALHKLLDSKHVLTQHVEDLKHQLASSQVVLDRIIQQEAQLLQARAALGAPLGY